jgi:gas vesicle protein
LHLSNLFAHPPDPSLFSLSLSLSTANMRFNALLTTVIIGAVAVSAAPTLAAPSNAVTNRAAEDTHDSSVLSKRISYRSIGDGFGDAWKKFTSFLRLNRDLAHVENDDDDDKAKRAFWDNLSIDDIDDIAKTAAKKAGDKIDELSIWQRDETQE